MTTDIGDQFRHLHRPGNPFIPANALDTESAKMGMQGKGLFRQKASASFHERRSRWYFIFGCSYDNYVLVIRIKQATMKIGFWKWGALFIAVSLAIPGLVLAERITVGSFEIDQTEVTVAQFAAYTDRVGLVSAAEREGGGFEWGAGWQRREGWNFRNPFGSKAAPDEPAVHLSWFEAADYCADAGGRLPSRQEWASAAYTEQRPTPTEGYVQGQAYPYPVGDSPDGMNNNRRSHVPVGTTRRGVNGLFDMGANAWEWLATREGDKALTAGGSWWYGPEKTRQDGMQWKDADFYVVYIGFRCVYG